MPRSSRSNNGSTFVDATFVGSGYCAARAMHMSAPDPSARTAAMRGNHFAEFNAFVTVAQYRNFRKAATQLGISTATLSHSIRGLEERLGVRLLNRTTRSVAPTVAGERLLARLRPVFADYEAALESVNEFRDKPAGVVRLTVAPGTAHFILAPLLPKFFAEYPDIRVDISV